MFYVCKILDPELPVNTSGIYLSSAFFLLTAILLFLMACPELASKDVVRRLPGTLFLPYPSSWTCLKFSSSLMLFSLENNVVQAESFLSAAAKAFAFF